MQCFSPSRCDFSFLSRTLNPFYLDCFSVSHMQIYFKKKKTGGISFNSTIPLTHVDEKLCYQILHEYKIHNAEVIQWKLFCHYLWLERKTGEELEIANAFDHFPMLSRCLNFHFLCPILFTSSFICLCCFVASKFLTFRNLSLFSSFGF